MIQKSLFAWCLGIVFVTHNQRFCEAFSSSPDSNLRSIHVSTTLALHPDQAQYLVECAQDIMKQAMEEKQEAAALLSRDISNTLKIDTTAVPEPHLLFVEDHHQDTCGPLAWARQRLWPFKQQGRQVAATMVAATKKLT